ncbi:hypothetical protein [Streptomyces noursei]|uniref:Uncharacterized protein n=1 Tax=Streptomyces noursei TaxID=1971 RepID=A0A2N8PQW0_STRNR|nr:hypothetical protein [Streptomyces noursei]PNE43412.1 hypothetical protein AOB60_00235 [Streptomyces noursei]
MPTLLITRWNDDDSVLTITESTQVEDDDQAASDAPFEDAVEQDGADWGCAYDLDRHSDTVQRAYEEHAGQFGAVVEDDVEGFGPRASWP